MDNYKKDEKKINVNTVCNVVTTIVLTAGTGFMVWWLWQMLPLLVAFD